MLVWLENLSDLWGPFRLFQFPLFRCVLAAGFAFFIGVWFGPPVIKLLKQLRVDQPFRLSGDLFDAEVGSLNKRDVPTMGGLLIVGAVSFAVLLCARFNIYVGAALLVFIGLAIIGYIDDYRKTVLKSSDGLAGRYKLLGQAVLTLAAVCLLATIPESRTFIRELWVPFVKAPVVDAMPWVVLFGLFFLVIAGSSNALNLTDGMDGLAIGCTITVAIALGIMAFCSGTPEVAKYLLIQHVDGTAELSVFCAAITGGGLAFLWFNAHPADVFMGDTGSLALGGVIGAIAVMIQQPFTLIIVGAVFVIEALSVILQVGSYKMRGGKRIFRMAPLHHHFEKVGWAETKITVRFWILSLICALAGLATLKIR